MNSEFVGDNETSTSSYTVVISIINYYGWDDDIENASDYQL